MAPPREETPPSADALAEAALLTKAIAGDVSALESLLISRHEQLLRYIERSLPANLQSRVSAEDLLQLTYLQVFKSIQSFEPKGPGAFFAWLKTIASRKLIDATRSNKHERQIGQSPAVGSGSMSSYHNLLSKVAQSGAGAGTIAMADELRGAFHVALANLPENYRVVVQLRYLEGLPLEEVAERLNITTGAARGLCHRARQAVRDEILRMSRFI
jgi:RNA polymerase sigma-70 factor (ECF subfamily)